ncbi:vitamin K epoxide reductase family protein [Candidatus Pacearchaeota archaeon]|nr:vitamin K epoxide reductase family protein [Candidatus Pacearchaeota archaeon]
MKYKIFLLVFIIGLISSIVLYSNSLTGICDPGKGCDVVNSSVYGKTLGVSNSLIGIFIFSFMIALTLFHIKRPNKHARKVIHLAIILGSAVAIYFLYLQVFVIKVICNFCILVDIGLLVALVFMFYLWEH